MNVGGDAEPRRVRVGVVIPTREAFLQSAPAGALVDFAVRAEELGFDSVWVGDSLTARPRLEPLTLLAAVAASTRRVTIGTAALTASLRPTALAAHSIATVDQLSGGRLVVGLGAGFPMDDTEVEFSVAGAAYRDRIRQLERNVAIWRWLWREPLAAPPSGMDQRTAEALRAMPRPARDGGPPLWLAGSGPKALARAGRLFDGWLPYPPSAAELEAQRAVVNAAAADRDTHVECAVYATVAVDTGCSGPSHRLECFSQAYYGFSAETLRLIQAVAQGTPERCASFLGDYVAAGADHLVLRVGDLEGASGLDALVHVGDLVRSRFPTAMETA